ncbi:M81 family metallopeptidase [Cohnella caldifontis]|uniref:M81 family metallopeptidase n=1 Tax=Cohnella caldifontis TaxID=3027471 RepID=UPI0023EB64CE|nr:M81 family metallopeptidase [Cohnella sp. YIM B05605]
MRAPRILVGAIIQESNTFSPVLSGMDDFRRHRYAKGADILKLKAESELGGFIRRARQAGAEIVPTLSAHAVSSGVFRREALAELTAELIGCLKDVPACDGVYFALHGAMVAEGCDDVEGELIETIRGEVGTIPFVVSLDLHGNVTRKMAGNVNGIVGFRTYPHADFDETGVRSAELLLSILKSGRRPAVVLRKLPMIVPAENSQSSHGPFAELWAEAREGESRGDSRVTSLFPVQPWLDIEEMGCAVVTVGDDPQRTEREADRLAELFWRKRHEFGIRLYAVDAIAELAESRKAGEPPIVISDSSDSPGAGSPGDSNYVLREFLRLGVHEKYDSLLTIVDPDAVAAAIRTGVGGRAEFRLGYRLCADGDPVAVSGTVRRIGDGRFVLQGGYAAGTEARMGRCAVIECGKLSVLVTERATFSGDPSMYRSMGLEPAAADIVLVKSANQFRADYGKLTDRIYILDTPGRSPADIRQLNYKKLQRPCYPFEDDFDWRNRE